MGIFLQVIGAALMLVGIGVVLSAKTAFHEIVAATSFGLGAAVIGLGAVTSRMDTIIHRLRPSEASSPVEEAPAPREKKDQEITWKNRGTR